MEVRPHLSQHGAAGDLPLLTESATATDVSPMDDSRNDEVLAEIHATLDAAGAQRWTTIRPPDDGACRRWIADRLNAVDHIEGGTPLNDYLPADRRGGEVGEKLAALQTRYVQPYPSLLRIDVETDEAVEFLAGQYLAVRYGGVARVYSVASSPNRGAIEFCVRRVPGGRMTSELAVDLDVGDELTLRGPYGDLLLEPTSRRDVVFLATGTGVAPFKAMIDYLFEEGLDRHEGEPRDVWLFLGAAWEDTLPYREAFEARAYDRENFHFVPTASRERYLTGWEGETAYVQHVLVKHLDDGSVDASALPDEFARYVDESPRYPIDARLDPSRMEVYACGINAMVFGLVDAVERLGVPPEHTQFEGYG